MIKMINKQGYTLTWNRKAEGEFSINIEDGFGKNLGAAAQIILPSIREDDFKKIKKENKKIEEDELMTYIEKKFAQKNPFQIQVLFKEKKPVVVFDSYGLAGGGLEDNIFGFTLGAAQVYAGMAITTLSGGLAAPIGAGFISSGISGMSYSIFTESKKFNYEELGTNSATSFVAGAVTSGVGGLLAPTANVGASAVSQTAGKVASSAATKTANKVTESGAKMLIGKVYNQAVESAPAVLQKSISNAAGKTASIVTETLIIGEDKYKEKYKKSAYDKLVSVDTPLEAFGTALGSEFTSVCKTQVNSSRIKNLKTVAINPDDPYLNPTDYHSEDLYQHLLEKNDISENLSVTELSKHAAIGAAGGGLGAAGGKVASNMMKNKAYQYLDGQQSNQSQKTPNRQVKIFDGAYQAALFGGAIGAIDGVEDAKRINEFNKDAVRKEVDRIKQEKKLIEEQAHASRVGATHESKSNLEILASKLENHLNGKELLSKDELLLIENQVKNLVAQNKGNGVSQAQMIKLANLINKLKEDGATQKPNTNSYDKNIHNAKINDLTKDMSRFIKNSINMNPDELNAEYQRISNQLVALGKNGMPMPESFKKLELEFQKSMTIRGIKNSNQNEADDHEGVKDHQENDSSENKSENECQSDENDCGENDIDSDNPHIGTDNKNLINAWETNNANMKKLHLDAEDIFDMTLRKIKQIQDQFESFTI